jgi:two-component system, chemotaxis family, chemotaxis protein CheY
MTQRILVVDDSDTIRALASGALRVAGYEVAEAFDGRDGADRAEAMTYDLVLTDFNMPRMDGITLIRHLRALPAYHAVPMLVMSTDGSRMAKESGRAAGATGWLLKPFRNERLLELVLRLLGPA